MNKNVVRPFYLLISEEGYVRERENIGCGVSKGEKPDRRFRGVSGKRGEVR